MAALNEPTIASKTVRPLRRDDWVFFANRCDWRCFFLVQTVLRCHSNQLPVNAGARFSTNARAASL